MGLLEKKGEINQFDLEELACHILNINIDDVEEGLIDLDDVLYEKLGIDLGTFKNIAERLIVLATIDKSPLTGKLYRGFANFEKGCWLAKIEINNTK